MSSRIRNSCFSFSEQQWKNSQPWKKRTSNYPMVMSPSLSTQDIVVCVWTSSRRVIISPSSPDSSWLDEVSVRCLFLRQVEDDDFVVVVHVCIFCQWCSVLASARAFCSRLASARAKVLALYMVCRISSSIAYGARSRPRPEPNSSIVSWCVSTMHHNRFDDAALAETMHTQK